MVVSFPKLFVEISTSFPAKSYFNIRALILLKSFCLSPRNFVIIELCLCFSEHAVVSFHDTRGKKEKMNTELNFGALFFDILKREARIFFSNFAKVK